MKKTLLKIAALLLVAGSLQAATITQTMTFSGTPNYTSNLVFSKFDTMNGTRTLTGVNVSIYLLTEAQGSVGIDNDGATGASGTVTMGTQLVVTKHTGVNNPNILDENGDGLSTILATTSKTMTLTGDDGDTSTFSTSGTDYSVMNVTATSNTSSIVIGSDYWSKYQVNGAGTFVFDATVSQSMDITAFGGSQQLINPMAARGNVVVTYDYIPEPATASLSIVVLLAAVWVRRRFID